MVQAFPDVNFRAYLCTLLSIGDENALITRDFKNKIESMNDLEVYEKSIKDLSRVNYFVNLKRLYCSNNNLEILDVSNNLELIYLDCSDNILKTLDVSNNTKLEVLYCYSNNLKTLDVSNNLELTGLYCNDNMLKTLDVSRNKKLIHLYWENQRKESSGGSSYTPAPIVTKTNYLVGSDIYDTSIKLAKELNKENKLSKLVLVNGEKGLTDAVSMGAVSAREKMPILLTNQNDDMKAIEELIDNKDISKSYLVGGESLFNKDIENKLPYVIKISGEDRTETNSKVIDYFYNNNILDNLYIAKNGTDRQNDLVDALSVGVLAGKTKSPVILVGDEINDIQKSLINKREFRNITQIDGNGNEKAFSEIESLVK